MSAQTITAAQHRELLNRAARKLPSPVARGLHVCSACGQSLRTDQALIYLAVADRRDPLKSTTVEAENIGFHADCHDQWAAGRLTQARAMVADFLASKQLETA